MVFAFQQVFVYSFLMIEFYCSYCMLAATNTPERTRFIGVLTDALYAQVVPCLLAVYVFYDCKME